MGHLMSRTDRKGYNPARTRNEDTEAHPSTSHATPKLNSREIQVFETVKTGNPTGLKLQLQRLTTENNGVTIRPKVLSAAGRDEHSRTLLHHAASLPKAKVAQDMIDVLLEHTQLYDLDGSPDLDYINVQDDKGDSALHCAAKKLSEEAVQKLLSAGAAVTIKNDKNITGMALVCAGVPIVLTKTYDAAVSLGPEFDPTDPESTVVVDFSSVIGTSPNPQELRMESDLIYHALDNPLKRRKDILEHAVLQLFLELKWQRLKWVNYGSILIHLLWHILSVIFTLTLFLYRCPIGIPDKGHVIHPAFGQGRKGPCRPDRFSSDLNMAVFIYTLFILGFEATQFLSQLLESKRAMLRYLKNAGTWFQFSKILLVIILCAALWVTGSVQPWMYYLTVVILVLSGILITTQAGNIPTFAPLVQELARVSARALWVMIVFSPIIAGFSFAFMVISSGKMPQFLSTGVALTKVFAMATGDITFDAMMDSNVEAYFPIFFRLLFVVFVVFCVLTLYNYIVSYSVSTIQQLFATAEVDRMANLLGKIHMMEAILFFFCSKLHFIPGTKSLFSSQLLVNHSSSTNGIPSMSSKTAQGTVRDGKNLAQGANPKVEYKIHHLPHRLREELIELGRRNANKD